jgi:hypothetical protein
MMSYDRFSELRARRNNIRRYRRLLETQLTDLERGFIERRLAEERAALDRLAASSPITFNIAGNMSAPPAAARLDPPDSRLTFTTA